MAPFAELSWQPPAAAAGAAALIDTNPAMLAGSRAADSRRASDRPNADPRIMLPPSLVGSPRYCAGVAESFGESQMNVRLSRGADRCVLWQRNADWSRRRAAPTPVARAGGTGAIRGVGQIRWCLGLRPLLSALRQPKWPMPGRVDAPGRTGGHDLADPPR